MDFIEKLVDQLPNILHTTTLPLNTPCLKPTNIIKTSQHGMQANEKHMYICFVYLGCLRNAFIITLKMI